MRDELQITRCGRCLPPLVDGLGSRFVSIRPYPLKPSIRVDRLHRNQICLVGYTVGERSMWPV